ncbi:MAG: radical SAM protein [Thermoprotei archaeon]|nr:radical SAM protein [Thermoprotei archaeon]
MTLLSSSSIKFGRLTVYFTNVKTALSRSGLPDLDYALNPYAGCSFGCIYCYARLYTSDRRASERWGEVVIVKSNIVKVLGREARRMPRGVVGLGTITDGYQVVESIFKLTRKSLETLIGEGFHVSVQTKSPMVLRDLDILATGGGKVDVGLTITTLKPEIAELIEPHAPPPLARLKALKKLSEAKIKTWVFYGPIIPGLNDDLETAESIASLSAETGSTLYYDPLRVKPFMLAEDYPLREAALKAKSREFLEGIEAIIKRLCIKYGLECRKGFEATPLTSNMSTL